MRRVDSTPRVHWDRRVEAAGLTWHSGEPLSEAPAIYWNESAFYEFTSKDIEALESSTNELATMTLHAAGHIIKNKLYAKMGIPESAVGLIESSWEAEHPSLYGRFDLAYDGSNPPKLLEYNADTPTSLLEAAVIQWYWLQDLFPSRDQFNSIHERLIARWKELAACLPDQHVDLCSIDDAEDGMTVTYLEDAARQAGLTTSIFPIDEVGWDGARFVGPDDRPLGAVFKLYPWEWMIREDFGRHLAADHTIWIEPPWKMLLSNKGILPVVWELYPQHPNLLETRFDDSGEMKEWIKKPLLGREGANITLHQDGADVETAGSYGAEGFIFQERAALNRMNGMHAVVGSWMIGHNEDSSCGIGVRESKSPIITNTSQFVPHQIG
ncbi:MAG TPA: glutathionylspermidine synthase family protein [Bryobacteraceae bacterium]|jgi:glutathionylspermidine synthase|nr:glutathionylspermidine synthase family protein [Bryobacteraceae bacterium]